MSAHIIYKSIVSSWLLAHVSVPKYADYLPFYRQQKMFAREGIHLPISTLADWVGQCGYELQPLVDALREEKAKPILKDGCMLVDNNHIE